MRLRNLCEIRPSTRESRRECSNLDQVRVTSLNLLRQIGIGCAGQIRCVTCAFLPGRRRTPPSRRTEESGIRVSVHQTRSRSHAEIAEGQRPQGCAERRPRLRRGLAWLRQAALRSACHPSTVRSWFPSRSAPRQSPREFLILARCRTARRKLSLVGLSRCGNRWRAVKR